MAGAHPESGEAWDEWGQGWALQRGSSAAQGLAGSQPLLAVGWELGWGWGTVGSQSPLLRGLGGLGLLERPGRLFHGAAGGRGAGACGAMAGAVKVSQGWSTPGSCCFPSGFPYQGLRA